MCRIPLVQRHATSPDSGAVARSKQDKTTKAAAAASKKDEDVQQTQDADERLITDVHGQATAAVDKIVRVHTVTRH